MRSAFNSTIIIFLFDFYCFCCTSLIATVLLSGETDAFVTSLPSSLKIISYRQQAAIRRHHGVKWNFHAGDGVGRATSSLQDMHGMMKIENFDTNDCCDHDDALLGTFDDENFHFDGLVLYQEQPDGDDSFSPILTTIGVAAQPIVWVSLYFVATTGSGLPNGPFGLLGGLEGIAYLVVLGLALGGKGLGKSLSRLSILAGLVVLASLVVDQGCVPNAKPILDYSDYLPVCNPDGTLRACLAAGSKV
jgi:hypothetical protein